MKVRLFAVRDEPRVRLAAGEAAPTPDAVLMRPGVSTALRRFWQAGAQGCAPMSNDRRGSGIAAADPPA